MANSLQKFDQNTALIVVDMQNDFMPTGPLGVAGSDSLLAPINQFAKRFKTVVLTQDWHPKAHSSFASTHNLPVFSSKHLSYGEQILWPDHCIQGTTGAKLHQALDIPHACLIIRKGIHQSIDSYSAFLEADTKTPTGLKGYLSQRQITCVYIVGVATDFCVKWTAIDACNLGFDSYVVKDLCRGIYDLTTTFDELKKAGVHIV